MAELPDGRLQPPMSMTCAETSSGPASSRRSDGRSPSAAPPISPVQSTGAAPATTAGPASAAASRVRPSTRRSRPSPTRWPPAAARSSPTRWSHQVVMDGDHRRAVGVRYVDRVTRRPTKCGPAPWCCVPRPSSRRASSSIRRRASNRTAWPTRAARSAVTSWTTCGSPAGPRRIPRPAADSDAGPAGAAERALCHPVPEHGRGPTHTRFRAGISASRAASASAFNWRAPGFGAEWVRRPRGRRRVDPPERIRRVPALRARIVSRSIPTVVDVFGIPVLRVHMAWGDNEREIIPDMAETAAEMLDAAGATEHPAVHGP